jgi:hypothetical protein
MLRPPACGVAAQAMTTNAPITPVMIAPLTTSMRS